MVDYRVQPPDDSALVPATGVLGRLGDAADEPAVDAGETRRCEVLADMHGERLDKLLVGMAPEFSRSYLQALIARGHVSVDGGVADSASRKVRVGQRVSVELVPTEESQAFRPEPVPLDIVFEDASLLVINKPAGLVVHPASGNWSGTLLNGLLHRSAAAAALPRAGIVHRLDKDTSGLMVVGKSLPSVTALVRAIAARDVHRQYLAITHGRMVSAHLEIDAPLGRDPASRVKMAVLASGKAARTDVVRLATTDHFTAVQCTLHSGRTHQIRVHLSHRGYPLVGDAVYGGRPALGLTRQALHAEHLAFLHPLTLQPLDFHVAPPADFGQAWAQVMPSSV